MCQFNATCPTTRHRPGTVCPVDVRARNRADKQVRQLWALAFGLAALLVMAGAYWFFIR